MLIVSVSTENVVYDIFVTLNATGEALTEGEKFRSFCLGRAYRTGATGAVKPLLDTLWKSIQQHGGDDPHSIFLHHYVSRCF